MRPGVRTRLTYRQIIAITSGVFVVVAVGSFFYFGSRTEEARAAVSGDYRSIASGSWESSSTWQIYNGSNWVMATNAPSASDNVIDIQTGHNINISSNITVDQLIIDAGSILNVNSGTVTISNGSGTDVQIDGTLNNFGTISMNTNTRIDVNSTLVLKSASTLSNKSNSAIYIYGRVKNEGGTIPTGSSFWYAQSGSIFEHARNGSTLPLVVWSAGSTMEVTGITNTAPTQLNQTFQNFTWNCSSQSTDINFAAAITAVNGNLTISSTGNSSIFLDQQGNNSTLTVGGNFNMINGKIYNCVNGSSNMNIGGSLVITGGIYAFNAAGGTNYGNNSANVYVTGNVDVTGGTIDLTQCTANNSAKGIGNLFLKGNLNVVSPGLITTTSSASRGNLNFNGTTANQITNTNTNITNGVDINILSGAVLQMDHRILTSQGTFNLQSGAGLWIGSANGITSSGASGNIQSTGTRTYSTGADYTYNGNVTQVSGNGLPSQVRNLTLNNSLNCTLTNSTSVSGTLTFTTGLWIASDDTLTLGTSVANLGTLNRTNGHVVGFFRRWIANTIASNILFPVGTLTYYNGANFSFTTAPTTGGSVTSNFIASGYLGTLGLPLVDAGDNCTNVGYAYWSLGSGDGFTGGAWSVNLYANGFPAVFDYTSLHVLRRNSSSANWTTNGSHSAGTGSNSSPVGNRTGMSILGQYGIVSGAANTLPIELVFFKAKAVNNSVDLTWKTATEVNNDYFTLERSKDGQEFEAIGTVHGAGNTTVTKNYKYTDYSPLKGVSFYRLRQTDFDGKTTTSEIQKVNIRADGMDHPVSIESVSPNPFTNEFTAEYITNRDGDVSIEIYDMQGKILYKGYELSTTGRNTFSFGDGGRFPNGQYVLRISHSGGVDTKKIIKR